MSGLIEFNYLFGFTFTSLQIL